MVTKAELAVALGESSRSIVVALAFPLKLGLVLKTFSLSEALSSLVRFKGAISARFTGGSGDHLFRADDESSLVSGEEPDETSITCVTSAVGVCAYEVVVIGV